MHIEIIARIGELKKRLGRVKTKSDLITQPGSMAVVQSTGKGMSPKPQNHIGKTPERLGVSITIGGDLAVARIGFGAMRLCGPEALISFMTAIMNCWRRVHSMRGTPTLPSMLALLRSERPKPC